jgi:spore germination cell wall hydrolase CwlJ-like protein
MADLIIGHYELCVWREARGEGVEGMRAVAWVIFNRAKAWNLTTRGVVMEPNHFLSMTVPPYRFPSRNDPQYEEAKQIVAKIIDGRDAEDPTMGALHIGELYVRAVHE